MKRFYFFGTLLVLCIPIIAMEGPQKKLKIAQENDLGEQLVKAAKRGDLERLNLLLRAGAPVDHVSKKGYTALIQAQNHIEVVRALIAAGADVNKKPAKNRGPVLSVVVANNRVEIAALLIAAGANVFYIHHPRDRTYLERAAWWGHQKLCELLVEKMASIPSESQKTKLYTVLNCFKRMYPDQYHNLRDIFKSQLRVLIKKENFSDPNSVVCREISKIRMPSVDDLHDQSRNIKQHLLQRYCNQRTTEDHPHE